MEASSKTATLSKENTMTELSEPGNGAPGAHHALDSGVLPGEAAMSTLSHIKMLKEKTFSDIILHAGKKAFAHSYVLWVRADGMLSAKDKANFEKKKKSRSTNTITVELAPPPRFPAEVWNGGSVLFWLLNFIYHGNVKFSAMQPSEVLYLDVVAKHYKLDRLVYLCESYLRDSLSPQNMAPLIRQAHDLQEATVKKMCLAFIMKNYQAFISNKDGVHVCGIDLFQEVVARNADPTPVPDEKPVPAANHYMENWKQIHDEMPFYDAVAKLGNERVKFHKAVLAAHSDQLAEYLRKNPSAEEVPFEISADAFKSMLRFIYYGERHIEPLHATELIGFSKEFALPELQKACEGRITSNVQVDTVLEILNVTYLPHMETRQDVLELRASSINYLLDNLTQVDLGPLRKMPATIPIDVLLVSQTREKRLAQGGSGQDFAAAAVAILRETSPRPPQPTAPLSPGRNPGSSKKNLNAAKDDLKKKEEEDAKKRKEDEAKAKEAEKHRKEEEAKHKKEEEAAAKAKRDEDKKDKKDKKKEPAPPVDDKKDKKEKKDKKSEPAGTPTKTEKK